MLEALYNAESHVTVDDKCRGSVAMARAAGGGPRGGVVQRVGCSGRGGTDHGPGGRSGAPAPLVKVLKVPYCAQLPDRHKRAAVSLCSLLCATTRLARGNLWTAYARRECMTSMRHQHLDGTCHPHGPRCGAELVLRR